jgi:hypothetical protein
MRAAAHIGIRGFAIRREAARINFRCFQPVRFQTSLLADLNLLRAA